MPKIAIDVSPLYNENSQRGVGFYTKNLVNALQQQVKSNSDYTDFDIQLVSDKSQLTADFDLIHYPFFDPFKLTLPLINKKPTVITVHDVIEREYKKHYPVGIRGELKWLVQRYLARKSNYLITVSHYSKYAISKLLNYPADKIYVTHLAASKNFKIIKNQKKLNIIKNKYQLPDKFVLFVGDISWNKNIPNLIKACLNLKIPLVIAGSAAVKEVPDHPWTIDIKFVQSVKSPYLHKIGFVTDDELPYIYNLATIYCQPSYAEGFGLPVLEAMQSGLPVIYSQETSLPEIVDYNGIMFDPYNQKDLINALKKLWSNSELRKKYADLGLKQSQNFDWMQTALQTLSIYKIALINGK